MEPTQRMMVIRLLEKMSLDQEMARRLQLVDISRYGKGGIVNEEKMQK